MSGPIDRQAAIDAVLGIGYVAKLPDGDTVIRMSAVNYTLRNLPSAQPEIIRCKDCDWWKKQEDSLQGRCALFGIYPTGAWYCANARKRGDIR